MPAPQSPLLSPTAALLIIMGLAVYPAYVGWGDSAAGLIYLLGLVPSFILVGQSLRKKGSQGYVDYGWLRRVSLSAALGVYLVFLVIRFGESYFWGMNSVYVLEKLLGLGVLALVSGGYPYLARPRYPGASLASALLFSASLALLVLDCYSPPQGALLALVPSLIVVNSLFEEGLFRGLLLNVFSARWGGKVGVALQGLLFSLWHVPHVAWEGGGGGLYYIAATLLVGLSLGVVVVLEGGLLTAVVVHTLWNLGVLFSCSTLAPLLLATWGALPLLFLAWGKAFSKGAHVYTG